jgi:dolichol-phosphate mannosyltransferase
MGFFIDCKLSFLYVLYAVFIKVFTDDAVNGWSSIMAGIYFLGGIQLVFLGLHGEYLGKIFMEVKNRPNYIVSESNVVTQRPNN